MFRGGWPTQGGVATEFLAYGGAPNQRRALALTLPHDVPVRLDNDPVLAGRLWRVMDAFGRKQAEWVPYWSVDGMVNGTLQDGNIVPATAGKPLPWFGPAPQMWYGFSRRMSPVRGRPLEFTHPRGMDMIRRFAAPLLVSLYALASVRAQVTVRKMAANRNPSLAVVSFDGPASAREVLVSTLKKCDWFSVISEADKASYRLRAVFHVGPPPEITIEVTSQAGARVAAVRKRGKGGRVDWLVYRAVDGLIRALFQNPGICASRIAFVNGPTGHKEIGTCNFDGSAFRSLTRNGSISTEPSWGPGAATLVYTLYGRTYTDVILMDLVNDRKRRLSQFPGLNAGADIGPSGKWAALCLSRDNAVELYLLRIADGALRRLTHDSAVESSPCWSPDGRSLCYVSDAAGRPHLYLLAAAGGKPVRLTSGAAEQVSPDWSSVSNRICFATRRGGRYVLAVVDMTASSREARIITVAPGDWEAPSWAPDGRHVVCTRTTGRGHALYMVDTWYEHAQPITAAGDVALPSWSDLF